MDERIQEGSFTRLERSFKLEKRPAKTRRAGVSAERTMVRPSPDPSPDRNPDPNPNPNPDRNANPDPNPTQSA